jgi:hypothetical protein
MEPNKPVNPRWYASALALAYAFFWVFHLLYIEWWFMLPHDQGAGPIVRGEITTKVTLVFLFLLSLLALKPFRLDRSASRRRQLILTTVLLIFFGLHAAIWKQHQRAAGFFVEDVGKMTIAADRLVLHGKNPYAADVNPQTISSTLHFDGYKYLPVTMAAYLPAATIGTDGDRGIVTTNLLLSILAALGLALCVRKAISTDAAILCAILFFIPEVISYEEVVFGSNDIVPMLLVIWALYNLERRFVCGLLVGLAISAKFLPGLLWIPLLITPHGHRRYAAGVATGLAVCLPFLLWDPHALLANTILFISARPWQPSALLYPAPEAVRTLAMLCIVGLYLFIARRACRGPMDTIRRCVYAAILALSLELASPTVHQNYFIWWFMPFCVAATAFVFSPITYEWMAG